MDHDAAIAIGPPEATWGLIAYEAVFHTKPVIRERLLIEEVAELFVEFLVPVIAYLEESILNPKRSREVIADIMACDLNLPSIEVLAVEQTYPTGVGGRFLSGGGGGQKEHRAERT